MIGPKVAKPTAAEERQAYDTATERDSGRCVRCGCYGTMHRDHRQNRSQGGLTVVSNLQLLCGPHGNDEGCHKWATEHPESALVDGFAVPGFARPELWPAWRFDVRSWVIYYDRADSHGRWWSKITESTARMLMNGGRE